MALTLYLTSMCKTARMVNNERPSQRSYVGVIVPVSSRHNSRKFWFWSLSLSLSFSNKRKLWWMMITKHKSWLPWAPYVRPIHIALGGQGLPLSPLFIHNTHISRISFCHKIRKQNLQPLMKNCVNEIWVWGWQFFRFSLGPLYWPQLVAAVASHWFEVSLSHLTTC